MSAIARSRSLRASGIFPAAGWSSIRPSAVSRARPAENNRCTTISLMPRRAGGGAAWQLMPGRGRLCRYRWWVRGWEICRSYQNCASRRDSHGRGSQAAQAGLAQLILVFPSGVLSSAGRWAAMRRGRAPVSACMSTLLPEQVWPGVLVLVPPARRRTAASGASGPVRRGQSASAGTSWSRHRSRAGPYHGDTPRVSPDQAPDRALRAL
jgi:hypothetical protein